jgi:hypothetical protein
MRPRPDHSTLATSAAVVIPKCSVNVVFFYVRPTFPVHRVKAKRFTVTVEMCSSNPQGTRKKEKRKMSVRITLIDATGPDWLGEVDSLAEAVEDVHEHWMEVPEGAQGFVLQCDGGFILAVMMRSQADPEICLTTYSDGRLEAHQCRYVSDGKGRHLQTEVTQMTRTGTEVVSR